MILVALGSNLPSPKLGSPLEICRHALERMEAEGLRVVRHSRWYRTAPVPASDQPWFVNGVAAIETDLGPGAVMAALHRIEAEAGRARSTPNAARVLDLDLLDFDGRIADGGGRGPVLPHPRLQERAFVLLPLRDVAPGWRHPASGTDVETLIAALPPGQIAEAMPDEG